jgi:hypothetical protein
MHGEVNAFVAGAALLLILALAQVIYPATFLAFGACMHADGGGMRSACVCVWKR